MDAKDPDLVGQLFDGFAKGYEAAALAAGGYHAHVAAFLAREALPGRRVLDVACGPGYLTAGLPAGVEVAGFDLSAKMIERAREARPDGRWVQADFHQDFPAELGEFDVVLLMSAFEFCLDLPAVVKRLAGATRPGGVLLLGITERRGGLDAATHPSPSRAVHDGVIEIRLFTLEDMVRAFRDAGLAPLRYESIHGWTDGAKTRFPYALWELVRPR